MSSQFVTPTDIWEIAIATALSGLATELNIPISALPKSATAVVLSANELIDFLFTQTIAIKGGRGIGQNLATSETLTVRIYLSDRYSESLAEKKAINWVASILRSNLNGLVLGGGATTPVTFSSQRLYAPEGGSWYLEQEYTFQAIS